MAIASINAKPVGGTIASSIPVSFITCFFLGFMKPSCRFYCTAGLEKAKEIDMEGFSCIFCTRSYYTGIHNGGESMIFYYFRLPASKILF